jgi:hypothetical protein
MTTPVAMKLSGDRPQRKRKALRSAP